MVSEAIKPKLRAALRAHEIGSDSPYRISFAGKGTSGGSFGFMQGDLAAGQSETTDAFRAAMAAAGVAAGQTESILARIAVPCATSPLSDAETELVDSALDGSKAIVDAMDETILRKVYRGLDQCMAAATAGGRTVTTEAQLYIALWINMTGPPTKLLEWLEGAESGAPPQVDGDAIRAYLRARKYYRENPRNFNHLNDCVTIGLAVRA